MQEISLISTHILTVISVIAFLLLVVRITWVWLHSRNIKRDLIECPDCHAKVNFFVNGHCPDCESGRSDFTAIANRRLEATNGLGRDM